MRINKNLIGLVVILFLSLLTIIIKRDSPFGSIFWLGVYGFCLSTITLLLSLGYYMIKRIAILPKLASAIPFFLGLLFLIVFVLAILDYRMLIPFIVSNEYSEEEYIEDLDFMRSRMMDHPGYDEHIDSLANLKFDNLYSGYQYKDRDGLTNDLAELVGLFNDGHSFVLPFQVFGQSRYLPLAGHYFEDGFYILKASDEYSGLVNRKLISIGGESINRTLRKIKDLTGPENDYNALSRLNMFLFCTTILNDLGIIENNKKVTVTYLDNDEIKEETINSEPFLNWVFWVLKPVRNRLPILPNLRQPNYQLHVNGESLELELNLIQNVSETNTLSSFADRLDSILGTGTIHKVIIDLRNNTGGNNQLYDPIITVILSHENINQKGNLIIWTSRNTFSAGINFLDDMKFKTRATLIGEPTGAGPTHYGDAEFHILPNSGIFFYLSTKQWNGNDTTDLSRTILPDVPVKFYYQDYLQKIDPWIKATTN